MLKNIWNLLPAILGTVQSILPMVKDAAVLIVRIIAVLPFLWSVDKPIINKINKMYGFIYGAVEKLKNLILIVK